MTIYRLLIAIEHALPNWLHVEELNTAPDHSLRLSRILLTSRFSGL